MKRLLLLIPTILLTANLFAQGTIQSFTVSPANPTTSDYVKVYVDLMFTSGGCSVYNQGQNINNNFIDAYALHCLGMLAFICTTTDTFNLGYLSVGNKSFRMSLSSGFTSGGLGCTPGIVPDDRDSVNFNVSTVTGIVGKETSSPSVLVYPNPFNSITMLKIISTVKFNTAELKVMDAKGKLVQAIEGIQSNEIVFKRDELTNGIYFYQLIENDKVISSGKFVME